MTLPVPAVILAGGRATRMGGGDKGLRPFGAGTLLSTIRDILAPQAAPLAINAGGDPSRFAALGLPVLADPLPGQPGPLAGVLAAMGWAAALGASRVLCVPCDTPRLPADLVARLAAQPGLVIARGDDGRDHPTIALWPVSLAADLAATLARGDRRVMDFVTRHGGHRVTFPAAALDNLNTQADLQAANSTRYDTFLIVDWSGGADTGPTPHKDAIWTCVAGASADPPRYHRNRLQAEAWLTDHLTAMVASGYRVLAGFDFGFAYPAGLAARLTGTDDPLALWDWLARELPPDAPPPARFDLAGRINGLWPGGGPFWGHGLARDVPGLPRTRPPPHPDHPAPRRSVEQLTPGTFTQWQLAYAGAVGSQTLTGLPVLARLRGRLPIRVWPFETHPAPITLAEVWPSLIAPQVRQAGGLIRDAVQVDLLARTLAALPPATLARLMDRPPHPEGWILGVGHETLLRDTAASIVEKGAPA